MATLSQTTLQTSSSLDRRLPTHHPSRDFVDARGRQDAYLGEDRTEAHGNHVVNPVLSVTQDRGEDVDAHTRHFPTCLSGECYSKRLNHEETDTDGMLYHVDPHSIRHHPSTMASNGNASNDVVPTSAEETERKENGRIEKDRAWQKVRQLLIEEEMKALSRTDQSFESSKSSAGKTDDDSVDTVKLLDALVRSGADRSVISSNVSDVVPVVNSSLARADAGVSSNSLNDKDPTFTRHIDRMSNKLSTILNRGQGGDNASNDPLKSPSSPPDSNALSNCCAGLPSTQLALIATLKQLTQTVQRAELCEARIAQISVHLILIDQIVSHDTPKENIQQKRGLHRLSRTQWSRIINDSSDRDKELREPLTPSKQLAMPLAFPILGENAQPRVVPTVLCSFKTFDAAQDLGETLAAFNTLLHDCGLKGVQIKEPWQVYCQIKTAVYSKLSFRHKQLFKLLDVRYCLDAYKRKPATRKRVCVIGAGPVGLRAALETALLGGHVVVLEKREQFSRESMLHLWPWVIQDLLSLGVKVFVPTFGKLKTHFHINMRQLQVVLLKIALLVGVTVYSSTEFKSIIPPGREKSGAKPYYMVMTQPQIPTMEFTAVLGASGANEKLAKPAGINRFVFNNKESLGIICYLPNLGTSDEAKVKEFSWTSQLKHPMLDKLQALGFDLENVVYYRGEMHYLVMTPKRQNLLDFQVLHENRISSADLVKNDNVNEHALQTFVKGIVDFAGIPQRADFTRVNLLDFSSLRRADKAASILSSHGKKLYVGLIGDSLLEPVWHEGVGISSGFLSALDGVWMVAQIGRKSDEQLLADRQAAYQVTMRLTSTQRKDMQKNVRKYTVDPISRYTI